MINYRRLDTLVKPGYDNKYAIRSNKPSLETRVGGEWLALAERYLMLYIGYGNEATGTFLDSLRSLEK